MEHNMLFEIMLAANFLHSPILPSPEVGIVPNPIIQCSFKNGHDDLYDSDTRCIKINRCSPEEENHFSL